MGITFGGTRLVDLQSLGQSIWLDEFHPGMLGGSQFAHWVDRAGISGAMSTPTILAKAFAGDGAYREAIVTLRAAGTAGLQIYDRLSIEDVWTSKPIDCDTSMTALRDVTAM